MRTFTTLALALLLPCSALASPPQAGEDDARPMPAWEQLTQSQRDTLIAPMRARWNDNPEKRARMYEHARRWQDMTPEQRERAHRGMKRWRHMDPEQREQARALFQQMRGMSPEQRKELRDRWHGMTPEQRRQWVEQNPPPPED
ncbi:DUF3106 domain-containing protein [Luteimonas mephitis]|uniref:DUF3106 domain-containing protein n=1 Tax=Luteimonas mephitis TaxID=83615 RepID=UPI00041999CF|nr:DUF3106 domain-containing protein [Luteimonas mephitis]